MLKNDKVAIILKILGIVVLLYFFLVSIKLIGVSFKLFGSGFAEGLISTYSNPFIGLFSGILATSIVQSSSTVTSLIVGLAGAGLLPIEYAIPIIMGANMGTTITNILVSLTFVTRKEDFRRAFAAATVHDFFNIFTIIVLLPLEMIFHPIEKSAVFLTGIFKGVGGVELTSPLQYILDPLTNGFKNFILNTFPVSDVVAGIIILIVSLALIIVTLIYMVKTLRALTSSKVESYVHKYLFRNTFVALLLGMLLTAVVQSSSVTTSLVVPLVAAGVIGLAQAYPFTLGANIGTTVTAILASLATVSVVNGESVSAVGVTVAFAHLLFNMFGVAIFLPLRKLPITCATRLADFAAESKKWAFIFVIVLFYLLPLLAIFITR